VAWRRPVTVLMAKVRPGGGGRTPDCGEKKKKAWYLKIWDARLWRCDDSTKQLRRGERCQPWW